MILRRFALAASAAAVAALTLMSPAAQAQSMVLKAADVHPAGYPNVVAVENMGKKLEAATQGRLKIQTFPGGVPYQVALVQGEVPEYMEWVRSSGFDGVEIAEDAMSYRASTDAERDDHIKMALDKGLFVDTELGKKNPEAPLDLVEAYDTMLHDLELGAAHVVIERSELGHYKGPGKDPKPLVDLVSKVGMPKVLIEPGPFGWPDYHDWTFKTFGPQVNVGNIYPHELLYVELSRRGLSRFGYWYFDAFEHKAR